ncbi:MAG: isoprenylcysteine carboxylmethyltransferase family protein [Archangiaceae bacterium]|nr:isoprenylcysteine carboxylmethyltransferase family protein [Archangiaceae bacterium]
MTRLLATVVPALVIVAPVALRPERLWHPAPWLLLATLMAVAGSQPPPPRGLWRDATDRRSALWILLASAATNLAAVIDFTARARLSPPPLSLQVAAGAALVAAGLGLRLWAIRALGRRFTALVRPPDGELVERGPYARLRHPSYTAVLLGQAGVCLMMGSALGAAVGLLLLLPAYVYRVQLEEAVLLEALGQRYRDYRHHTLGLLPFAGGLS